MTDVFLNHSAKDREVADRIYLGLKDAGLKIWQDRYSIKPGENFASSIKEALEGSKCVLTLWTPASIDSQWVFAEAEFAQAHNTLFPVALGIKYSDIPPPFRAIQTLEVDNFNANTIARLATNIKQFIGHTSANKVLTAERGQGVVDLPSEKPIISNKRAFVSYSSEDEEIAIELVGYLEKRNCPCWIAFRDVDPGEDYRTCVVNVMPLINFLVLIYSTHVNKSFDIQTELLLARKRGKRRFVLRTDESDPGGPVEYELATVQWIDCKKDRRAAFEVIAKRSGLY